MREDLVAPQFGLAVYIRDPEKLIFKGVCESVSATNSKGLFDVLGVHENFITIIKEKVTVRQKEKSQEFPFPEQGILKVEENVVHIFLGTETI